MLLIIFNYQTFSVASLSLNKLYFQKETCFVTFADLEICHTFILLLYHQTMVYVFCSMTTFKAQWLLALDCTLNSFQVGAQPEAAASKTLPSGLWRAQASLISALRAKCACDKMLVFFILAAFLMSNLRPPVFDLESRSGSFLLYIYFLNHFVTIVWKRNVINSLLLLILCIIVCIYTL